MAMVHNAVPPATGNKRLVGERGGSRSRANSNPPMQQPRSSSAKPRQVKRYPP